MRYIPLLPTMALLLSACASEPDPMQFAGKVSDSFQTEIKRDGMKLFTYTVTAKSRGRHSSEPPQESNDNPMTSRQGQPGQQRGKMPSSSKSNPLQLQLETGLKRTLEANGYCRSGYYELSRLELEEMAEFRGECQEGADEQDIAKYGYGKSSLANAVIGQQ